MSIGNKIRTGEYRERRKRWEKGGKVRSWHYIDRWAKKDGFTSKSRAHFQLEIIDANAKDAELELRREYRKFTLRSVTDG